MCDFEYFAIENSVDELRWTERGFYTTLDLAKEALKHKANWSAPYGTGDIYRHQFTINPDGTITHEKTQVYSNP